MFLRKMKKIFLALMVILALGACSNGEKPFSYRGLSMALPFQTFCDSLAARGFAVDSTKTDAAFTRVVMAHPTEKFRLMLAQQNGQLIALQENYQISTNDSTRRMWQQKRDELEKEFDAWPNMPLHGDDHKVAKFEAEGGFVTVTLENTYTPTLQVLYEVNK